MRAVTMIVLGGMTVLAAGAWAGGDAPPAWLTDFAAAQAQAQRERRPILAVLH